MNGQSNSVDHDMVGRLSTIDTQMMMQKDADVLYKCSREPDKNDISSPTVTLSSTPQDTAFMTEENMKKIHMPKRIEF
ncbi:hypothetical protein FRACYDRAFT_267738 [Fragilariopsis cylindrus CCMP1102]|uniref:Uncharacterized protein n=1 Tax=Fragilariopsis cylindrus CCMP1102 TaxID=635003 RepID=A0A1E7FRE2_9STRA|nr:hypothetical protein FRACYDRAFT_267738 [Fragilariopsis cylindrus CCMP1102]|eukprot:OEU20729.1 hypothetical protein FRACYDRAFT_267738 [Fragilariopsis cylindrus CCMP1102]